MKTSQAGINLIKHFEGFSPIPYMCPSGILTIGYGCTHYVTHNMRITESEAEDMLRSELSKFESSVKKLITAPLNQNQFDALVSFVYNLGGGALQRSRLRMIINRGDYKDAPDQFMQWIRGGGRILPGLVKRRRAEANLFSAP